MSLWENKIKPLLPTPKNSKLPACNCCSSCVLQKQQKPQFYEIENKLRTCMFYLITDPIPAKGKGIYVLPFDFILFFFVYMYIVLIK